MPIDVNEIGCDMLSATGRKYLRGPRGTGFLYVREGVIEQLEPPFLDMQAAEWASKDTFKIRVDARRFENWETNYAGKIGLGVAVDYALNWGLAAIEHRIRHLAERLRDQLSDIDGVKVQDLGQKKCGIVSFTVEGKEPSEIKQLLSEKNINLSVSSAQGTRLDMDARGLTSVLRASVHYYNTEAEVERFCTTLASLV
jgi:selenocysteine lyase/cysteine desulfurase